jgi:hypothetical protein
MYSLAQTHIRSIMFNIMDIFRKKNIDTTNVLPFPELVKVPKSEPTDDMDRVHCHYTVGTDENGNVVLKIHALYGSTSTLTMNGPAVRHMIGLLEAAILDKE